MARAAIAASITAAFMGAATQSWATGGWVWRMPAELRAAYNFDPKAEQAYHASNWKRLVKLPDFQNPKPNRPIIGDSQAADIANLLVEAGQEEKFELGFRQLSYLCGLPILPSGLTENYWKASIIGLCKENYAAIENTPALAHADVVIVAMAWLDSALPYIQASLDEIHSRTHASIYIVGGKTLTGSSLQLLNKNGTFAGIGETGFLSITEGTKRANSFLKSVSRATSSTRWPLFAPTTNASCSPTNPRRYTWMGFIGRRQACSFWLPRTSRPCSRFLPTSAGERTIAQPRPTIRLGNFSPNARRRGGRTSSCYRRHTRGILFQHAMDKSQRQHSGQGLAVIRDRYLRSCDGGRLVVVNGVWVVMNSGDHDAVAVRMPCGRRIRRRPRQNAQSLLQAACQPAGPPIRTC